MEAKINLNKSAELGLLQRDKLEGMDKELDQQTENNKRDMENGVPLGQRLRQKIKCTSNKIFMKIISSIKSIIEIHHLHHL